MKRGPFPVEARLSHWKDLYIAALFETDKAKLPERIREAEVAIVTLRQKSMRAGVDSQERRVLDSALLSLQALASCVLTARSVAA